MSINFSNMKSISIDGKEMKEVYIDGKLVWKKETSITFGCDPVDGHPVSFYGLGSSWTDEGYTDTSYGGDDTWSLSTMNGDELVWMVIDYACPAEVDLKYKPLAIELTLDDTYSSLVCSYEVYDCYVAYGTYTAYVEVDGSRRSVQDGSSGTITTVGSKVTIKIGFTDLSNTSASNYCNLAVSIGDIVASK